MEKTAGEKGARASAQLSATLAAVDARCNATVSRKASRYLSAYYDKALSPARLRTTQFTILARLARRGQTTISALAGEMAMDRTTLATNLKPLEREGLLTIGISAADARARTAAITESGLARLEQAVPLWQHAQERFEEAFGPAEAALLRSALESVLSTGLDPWRE
jgi:DNA-binding MarR family transcriptional regulator